MLRTINICSVDDLHVADVSSAAFALLQSDRLGTQANVNHNTLSSLVEKRLQQIG
jgi:hypothetical protein